MQQFLFPSRRRQPVIVACGVGRHEDDYRDDPYCAGCDYEIDQHLALV